MSIPSPHFMSKNQAVGSALAGLSGSRRLLVLAAAMAIVVLGLLLAVPKTPPVDAAAGDATGTPLIIGTVQASETLTMDMSEISDVDGTGNATFEYQWISSDGTTDTDIAGATSSTYVIKPWDLGKHIKVRVSFTDDAGNKESLTSAGTAAVEASPNHPPSGWLELFGMAEVGQKLRVVGLSRGWRRTVSDANGLTYATFNYQWLRDDETTEVEIPNATGQSYTLTDADEGKRIKVRLSFTDDGGNVETLTSIETNAVTAMPTTSDLAAPTAPTVGRSQGEEKGLELSWTAPEGNVDSYQILRTVVPPGFSLGWYYPYGCPPLMEVHIRDTGSDATTYTDTDVVEGETYVYGVRAMNSVGVGRISSSSYEVQYQPDGFWPGGGPRPPWGIPTNLAGSQIKNGIGLTWEAPEVEVTGYQILRRSPEQCEFGYRVYVDNTNSTDTHWADRNVVAGTLYEYHVRAVNDVGVVGISIPTSLRPTTLVVGPEPNNPATGTPTIAGTPQVGETLTADPSGIADTDGMHWAILSYQWLSSRDTEIEGATSPAYTLQASDANQVIKVRVDFMDDSGYEESRTSAATAAVSPNIPATGAPTITGTVAVGETLTGGTSGIVDSDGLDNASYSYQWLRKDGRTPTDYPPGAGASFTSVNYRGSSAESEINGATSATYTVTAADVDKTIKLRVDFNDDKGYVESRTSTATVVVPIEAELALSIDGTTVTCDSMNVHDDDIPKKECDDPVSIDQGASNEIEVEIEIARSVNSQLYRFEFHVNQAEDRIGHPKAVNADDLCLGPGLADSVTMEVTPDDGSGNFKYTDEGTIFNLCPVGTYLLYAHWYRYNYEDQEYEYAGKFLRYFFINGDDEDNTSIEQVEFITASYPDTPFPHRKVQVQGVKQSTRLNRTLTTFSLSIDGLVPDSDRETTDYVVRVRIIGDGGPVFGGVPVKDVPWCRLGNVGYSYLLKTVPEDGRWAMDAHVKGGCLEGPWPDTLQVELFNGSYEFIAGKDIALGELSNSPATGAPTISGTAQVGQTLAADTADIADADGLDGDGLDNVVFNYQWVRNDGGTDTDIEGETASTYDVSEEDVGKTIKVRVTFTDDRDNEESQTSAATETVAAAAIWSATMTVGVDGDHAGYSYFGPLGELSSRAFSIGETGYTVWVILHDADKLYFRLSEDTPANLSLHVGGVEFARADATVVSGQISEMYTWPRGTVGWSAGDTVPVVLSRTGDEEGLESAQNSAPTGLPTITGTPQAGETLTADKSGIADADGLTNPNFSYQWIRNDGSADTDIGGETAPTYTPSNDDVGKTIKVEVTFTDDADNEESLTSGPTAEVAATVPGPPQHLNVSRHGSGALDLYWEAPASDGGSPVTGYKVQWKETDDGWGAAEDVSEETVTGNTHTLTGLTDGVTYSIRVLATNDIGDGTPSGEETGTPHETTPPELAGATVDGGTLTLTYSEGLDEASEPETGAFKVAVDGTLRGVDEVSVSGNAVVLTLASAVAAGDTLSVTYTAPTGSSATPIRDLPGNAAASFGNQPVTNNTRAPINSNSAPTGLPVITGTAQVDEILTVDVSGIDDADGLDNANFSYQWIRTEGGTDTDIAGETVQTYSPSDADAGKTIKVRVTFTDDAENEQSLTSEPTAVVVAATTVPGQPMHLRVFPHDAQGLDVSWEAPASDGGSPVTGYKVQWKEADGVWDAPVDVSQETVSGTTHTINGLTDRVKYVVRVIARNDIGDGAPTAEAMGTPRETTPPQMVMARVDGATLRVSYDEALDEDSVPSTDAFLVKVACRCDDTRWQDEEARRGVEGVSVDGDAVVLTLASVATAEDDVVISYTPPQDEASPRVLDAAGNAAAAFRSTLVFNDTEESGEEETAENAEPTGLPTISGTLRVGETLTASTSGIADADGTDNASFSYQWMRSDGNSHTDIAGETGQTYELSGDDVGRTIQVRVTFTDDADNEESLTSAATGVVAPRPPLTASIQGQPSSHDGQADFTFELHFSEEVPVSYVTLRDHAFTVTGGAVGKAQRLTQGSNIGWRITVQPDSTADVTVLLPVTTDCDATGAVCTGDGRMLSNRNEFTVSGPTQ